MDSCNDTEKFYSNGLRWTCLRCSYCCRHEEGYVFLSKGDLARLSSELNMTGEEFTRTFCRWVHLAGNIELLAIKEKSNNDCFFWKDRCTVYNARPTQCRTYPFWEGFLADEAGWKTGTEDCPGINSGRLYTSAEIEECIAAERAEPPLARKKSDG